MEMNSKYYIKPDLRTPVLQSIENRYLAPLTKNEIGVGVHIDEYFQLDSDIILIQREYLISQYQEGELRGKPQRIKVGREGEESEIDLGYTSIIDLRRIMSFLRYHYLGILTQVQTSFCLRNDLIDLPITINETKEYGLFLEIGRTVGPERDIENLLVTFEKVIGISPQPITIPYSEMLVRIKRTLS